MKIQELLTAVNTSMEALDLVSARRYIEDNMELLNENKHHLRANARALLDFLNDQTESPLNRQELNVIHSINTYASRFDIRGLKLSVKNNFDLLVRDDVKPYFTEDAKVILEGMNVIH
ncbi:hypothetical protein AB1K83_12215 [Sporosarcina sp. 179-K 3D1 HS]|uniref:hypothetical protein n=1 Tax=Sporosarcina sp. 179-K 3D1 HS TaxID=3232169 RepID=UPI0039A29C02